jgi:hypothetical protein
LERSRAGFSISEEWIKETQQKWKLVFDALGKDSVEKLDPGGPLDELDEVEAHLDAGVLLRDFDSPLSTMVRTRVDMISSVVDASLAAASAEVRGVTTALGSAMRRRGIVRVAGAGRALLAASLPANRLAHGGAMTFILGDRTPFPNSQLGGVLLAASASGKTRAVLEVMNQANQANAELERAGREKLLIIGIADRNEPGDFRRLCSPGYFVGMDYSNLSSVSVTLRALADLEEQAICQLLDSLIVLAGLEIGVVFRAGHEDIGPTGPWHQLSK